MKIALQFKKEIIEKHGQQIVGKINQLKIEYGFSSMGALWLYDITNLDYINGKIRMSKNNIDYLEFDMNDIEYYEVHKN